MAGKVDGDLDLLVYSDREVDGCLSWEVVAVAHRRREHLLRDPRFGHTLWRAVQLGGDPGDLTRRLDGGCAPRWGTPCPAAEGRPTRAAER